MNSIQLIGRLVADPQVHDGTRAVARLRVAVDRVGGGRADVVPVVVFDRLAEVAGEHLAKGRLVGITGRVHMSRWTAADGSTRSALEVIGAGVTFLDRPTRGSAPARPSGESAVGTLTQDEASGPVAQDVQLIAS